ncbi:MAG: ester cyclase [Acidobacteria bacterium]|nr:ester cyclase [Acidobacteriota bacterium]
MKSESMDVMHRWVKEVWNKKRKETIDEIFADAGVARSFVGESGQELRDHAGSKPFFRRFRNASPDLQVAIEDCFTEGERAVARCTVNAKQTGNPVEFTGISIIRAGNGKIVEAWNNFDFMSLNQQVAVI